VNKFSGLFYPYPYIKLYHAKEKDQPESVFFSSLAFDSGCRCRSRVNGVSLTVVQLRIPGGVKDSSTRRELAQAVF
jgi:hypothetical protein